MKSDEAIVAVIDRLEAAGVSYMLVGSLSSNFYGIARSTKDADIDLCSSRNELLCSEKKM